MKTLLTLLLFAVINSSEARIHETLTQCLARYGKPIATDAESATWCKENIVIKATFRDEVCDWIQYHKPSDGLNQTFSRTEVEALQGANHQGSWLRDIDLVDDSWTADDKAMLCVYHSFTRIVEFKTIGRIAREKLEAEAQRLAKEADEKAKLKGF